MISRIINLNILLILLLFLQTCRSSLPSENKAGKSTDTPTYNPMLPKAKYVSQIPAKDRVSDSLIYAFMSDYIDHTPCISVTDSFPSVCCGTSDLRKYIENKKDIKKFKPKKHGSFITEYGPPLIVIKQEDYEFMANQLNKAEHFKWDIKKFHTKWPIRFGSRNENYFAYLSIPIFTKDKKSALITVDNTLIGGTRLFTFHDGHWVDPRNEIPFDWIH
jgi:hypothetical protein